MNTETIVQKIWSLCNILRGDGVSYHEYISELTYLLFLKIAEENKSEKYLPEGRRWGDLINFKGDDLLSFYREMLTYLGEHAPDEQVRKIYAFPTTVFSHSENLKAVIHGIAKLDWHAFGMDRMGDIYEGLLAKNSQDARSGAGQYFTPRPLVDCIVRLVSPALGEVIQDPAMGSGGFLISADQSVRLNSTKNSYAATPPFYEGVEIEKGTYRIALMNAFLHRISSSLILGDALTEDANGLSEADVILANPPFGVKSGSARLQRDDFSFPTANKQLAFLQHIYLALKPGGRAAVVLPDNVLFEDGVGKKIRQELMSLCQLHTILRLPSGIFYSPGVKTNVLFFSRCEDGQKGTQSVWIYDMRFDAPRFGRKRPLSDSDFAKFEKAFGKDPRGLAKRSTDGFEGRWKCFSRQQISDRNDSLNLAWLGDGSDQDEAMTEPDEIALVIQDHLRAALREIEAVTNELAEADEAGEVVR